MLNKIYKFRIDLKHNVNVPYMEFFQTDLNTSLIKINITNDNEIVDLENCTSILLIKKQDDTEVILGSEKISIIDAEKGKMQISLPQQALSSLGTCKCELTLFEYGQKISIHSFTYNVVKSLDEGTDLSSTNEYTFLTGLMNDVQEVNNILDLNENERKVAETSRQQNFSNIQTEYVNIKTDLNNVKSDLVETNEIVTDNEDTRIFNETNRINKFIEITTHYDQEKTTLTNLKNDLVNTNKNVSDEEVIRITNENNRGARFGVISDTWNDKEFEINSLVENVTNSELIRNEDEYKREVNESIRMTNEDVRKLNENQRISNENVREDNENTREQQELVRVDEFTNIKSDLASVKSDLINSNNSMKNEEALRQNNESDRVESEIIRKNNEVARENGYFNMITDWTNKNNELDQNYDNFTSGVSNQWRDKSYELDILRNDLVNSEGQRISNENIREGSEISRVNNEVVRERNESSRQSSIADIENRFNNLTTAQQQASEVINARTSTIRNKTFVDLNARIAEIEKDILTSQSTSVVDSVVPYNVLANAMDGATDIGIKGQTLVNLVKNGVNYANWTVTGTSTKGTFGVKRMANSPVLLDSANYILKPNTVHTIFINITEISGASNLRFTAGLTDVQIPIGDTLGMRKIKITTTNTLPQNIQFIFTGGEGTYFVFKEFMILEGDYTTQEVPHFEGIASVEDTVIKSVGENLFDNKVYGKMSDGGNIDGRDVYKLTHESAQIWSFKGKPNTQYTITFEYKKDSTSTGSTQLEFLYSDGTKSLIQVLNNVAWAKVTSASNVGKTLIGLRQTYVNIGITYFDKNTFMLNEGSVAKAYTPYKESKIQLSDYIKLEYFPFRSLPNNVSDEVVGGKVVKRVKEYTLQASDITAFNVGTNNDTVTLKKPLDFKLYNIDVHYNGEILIPNFIATTVTGDSVSNVWKMTSGSTTTTRLFVPRGYYSSLADAQAKLTGTTVIYQLATPQEYQLDRPLNLPIYKNGSVIVEPTKLYPKLSYSFPTNLGKSIESIFDSQVRIKDTQQFILSYLLDIETRLLSLETNVDGGNW